MRQKNLDYYLGVDYPFTVHADPDGGFVAEIEDLPWCMTWAKTPDELFAAIQDARCAWIKAAYEMGQDIPLPKELRGETSELLLTRSDVGCIVAPSAIALTDEYWEEILPVLKAQAQHIVKCLQENKNDGSALSKRAGWLILYPEEWQKILEEVGL